MPLPTTFAADSVRGKGLFNGKITYTAPTINTSGVITSMTTGATSGGNVSASGGSGSYSYSVYSGSLPYNLTLNTSTGYITGTLQAGGTFNVVFNVTDTVSGLSTQSGTVTITTTYNHVYVTSSSNPLSGTSSDLSVFSLDLGAPASSKTWTDNTFGPSGTSITQICTDYYGRIFGPQVTGDGLHLNIWDNGSASVITNSTYTLAGGCVLGSDNNTYVGYLVPGAATAVIIKFTPSLTQTVYTSSIAGGPRVMCSNGGSKIYFSSSSNSIIYSFDISTNTFASLAGFAASGGLCYGGDGNLYTAGITTFGTRTSRGSNGILSKITLSGTLTNYTVFPGGTGSFSNAGTVCAATLSGTSFIAVGGYADGYGCSAFSLFNTSSSISIIYPITANSASYPVNGVCQSSDGSIYGAANYIVARLNSGTITNSYQPYGNNSWYAITTGP